MGARLGAVALLLVSAAAQQGAPAGSTQQLFASLLQLPADVADRRLAEHLASLVSPEQQNAYLLAAAGLLWNGSPALPAPRRIAFLAAHAELLRSPTADVERFLTCSGRYLAEAGLFHEAILQLERIEQRAIDAPYLVSLRRTLHIDWLFQAERLAEAQALCQRWHDVSLPPAERVTLHRQAAQVQIHLGRLDIAGRMLQRADAAMAELVAKPQVSAPELARLDLGLFQQHADLMLARERFEPLRVYCADFLRQRELEGRPLDPAGRAAVLVRDAVALAQLARSDEGRLHEAMQTIEALLREPAIGDRHAAELRHSLCVVALLGDRFELARRTLADMPPGASRRARWKRAPLAALLGRRTGAAAAELREHQQDLRRILDEMIAEWRSVPCENDGTGFLLLGNRMLVLAELIALNQMLDGDEAALQPLLEVQACTSLSRRLGADTPTLARLRTELLAEGHGALLFVPALSGSFVFALDREQIVHDALEPADRLQAAVRSLRRELASLDGVLDAAAAEVAEAGRAAERLAELLLPAEVLDRLTRWQQVTVSGGALLGGLPIECLRLPDGRWFGEAFAVTQMDSMPLALLLCNAAQAGAKTQPPTVACLATLDPGVEFATRNGIVLGSSIVLGNGGLGDLLDGLLDRVPEQSRVFVGTLASPTAFRQSAGADLTVLLAHGQPPQPDSMPALGLSADAEHPAGTLAPEQILATSQRGVVVLSACYAARGPLRRGDDDVTASLAGAFLAAGAVAVVGSEAPLGLALHVDLATGLVDQLLDGVHVAEAMRRARVATAAGDDLRSLRAGQVSVFGCGRAVVGSFRRSHDAWHWPLLAALGAAVALGSIAVARRGRRPSAIHPTGAAAVAAQPR